MSNKLKEYKKHNSFINFKTNQDKELINLNDLLKKLKMIYFLKKVMKK